MAWTLLFTLGELAGVTLCAGEVILTAAMAALFSEPSPTRKTKSKEWHGVE